MVWVDEGERFAGQFFRVIGEGWRAVQAACASRISQMQAGGSYGHSKTIVMPQSGWSPALETGKGL